MLDTCQNKYVLYSMQKSIRRDISAVLWQITAMPVRLAQTISSKYYVLLFSLNLIITTSVILLAYSTVCSDVIIILHQARGASPYSWLKVYFFPDWRYYKTKQDRDFKP